MRMACPPIIGPDFMRDFNHIEETKGVFQNGEKETSQSGADHPEIGRSGSSVNGGSKHRPGVPSPGDQRSNIPSLAQSIWRDEGRRSQAAKGTGKRECPAQEAGRRFDAGQGDIKGAGGGKLLSPVRRKKAVEHVEELFPVSERRACQVTGQHRSTQRYQRKTNGDEMALIKDIHELVGRHPRYGYRRITALLRQSGWNVNRKRVHRIWKQEGLKVPQKVRKKRYVGRGANACDKRKAEHINDVWTLDFVHDRLVDGRQFKCLAILDEYTRENLSLVTGRSITGDDVLSSVIELIAQRGMPNCIRSDNGPEFVSKRVKDWLNEIGVGTLFIEPGAPWQNGYVESFNSRFRDEFLNMEIFNSLKEVRQLASRWRDEYNCKRPHSSLNYLTPVGFAASCRGGVVSASLRSATPTPPRQMTAEVVS